MMVGTTVLPKNHNISYISYIKDSQMSVMSNGLMDITYMTFMTCILIHS